MFLTVIIFIYYKMQYSIVSLSTSCRHPWNSELDGTQYTRETLYILTHAKTLNTNGILSVEIAKHRCSPILI